MHPTGSNIARRLEVRGLVQGVWYRASCRDEALRLGIVGWVTNRPDGTVAAHVEGRVDQVDDLVLWCRAGPLGARVDEVLVESVEPEGHPTFEIR